MKTIEIPRDTKEGKRNPQITILCDELCKAIFDKDTEGKPHHIWDITKEVFPQLSRSYPEIKTRKQAYVYVLWSMKALCWNNRAKLVEQDWFEAPHTASEAINDHLPEGSAWEARVPGKFDHQTKEQKKVWRQSLELATLAVKQLKTFFPTWTDQHILDTLYAESCGTKYANRSVETALRSYEWVADK